MSSPSISVGDASRLKNSGSLVRLPALPMSARGLMIVIATEFTPLSPLTFFFSTMNMWESSQRLGKNNVHNTGEKKEGMDRCTVRLKLTEIMLKTAIKYKIDY